LISNQSRCEMEKVSRKYDIIYADPPWEYRVWSKKGSGRSAEAHYTTQSLGYLACMDIASLCNPDCVLFMWATFPCLLEAFALGKAWGFIYKTVAFVWIKRNQHNQNLSTGMGYYTRANAEVVLLFTKGKALPRTSKNVSQVLISPKGKHSQKPPEIRNRIERLFGDRFRLELFARSRDGFFQDVEYEGWDVFGNEANRSISINLNRHLFPLKI
jgi:N6-adenosine-specific RNA methylase IME4